MFRKPKCEISLEERDGTKSQNLLYSIPKISIPLLPRLTVTSKGLIALLSRFILRVNYCFLDWPETCAGPASDSRSQARVAE